MTDHDRYQTIGTIDGGAIEELGYDTVEVFEAIAEAASDITVVYAPDAGESEQVWHQDYENGWLRVGVFETEAAAQDADYGFAESVVVHNYGTGQAELYAKEEYNDD